MTYPSKDQAKRNLFSSLVEGLLKTNGTGCGLAVDQTAADTQAHLCGLVYGPCEVCRDAPIVAFALDRQGGEEVGVCGSERCYRAAKAR